MTRLLLANINYDRSENKEFPWKPELEPKSCNKMNLANSGLLTLHLMKRFNEEIYYSHVLTGIYSLKLSKINIVQYTAII